MTRQGRRRFLHGLLVLFAAGAAFAAPARACLPVLYADDGAYVGGSLAQQIAQRAHTIQIARARTRHLMATYYPDVESYWYSGQWRSADVTERGPRRRDLYVFDLEIEATLKGGVFRDETPARVRAYDEGHDPQLWPSLNYMLGQSLARPGWQGAAWNLAAVDPESETSCHVALTMRVGERYLILRDDAGRVLSPARLDAEWGNTLPINVEFTELDGGQARFTVWAPGVMRLDEPAQALVRQVQAALD